MSSQTKVAANTRSMQEYDADKEEKEKDKKRSLQPSLFEDKETRYFFCEDNIEGDQLSQLSERKILFFRPQWITECLLENRIKALDKHILDKTQETAIDKCYNRNALLALSTETGDRQIATSLAPVVIQPTDNARRITTVKQTTTQEKKKAKKRKREPAIADNMEVEEELTDLTAVGGARKDRKKVNTSIAKVTAMTTTMTATTATTNKDKKKTTEKVATQESSRKESIRSPKISAAHIDNISKSRGANNLHGPPSAARKGEKAASTEKREKKRGKATKEKALPSKLAKKESKLSSQPEEKERNAQEAGMLQMVMNSYHSSWGGATQSFSPNLAALIQKKQPKMQASDVAVLN